MTDNYEFKGWQALSKDCVKGQFEYNSFTPKTWTEGDVDIQIQYCGICASDLHTASSGWGQVKYPLVVGHEIVGKVVRVGKDVSHVKLGDLVGVGAQNDSCRECKMCKSQQEPYCDKGQVGTYNGTYYRDGPDKGDLSQGGYADYHRAPAHFVVKIPDGLDPAIAAPMLCGGVTVYSPLKKYGAGTTAKDVGIVGIGGLGHFGLLFAKALGANVTAISHSTSKQKDAERMGATNFIATGDGSSANFKSHKRSLDLIISTSNDTSLPIAGYLSLLRQGGTMVLVGAPEKPLPQISAFLFLMNNVHLTGSAIGSPSEISEMLELASKQDIKSWIIKRDMETDLNGAIVEMDAGKARYRYVLVNQKNGGKMGSVGKL